MKRRKIGKTNAWLVDNEIIILIGPDWGYTIVMLVLQLFIASCYIFFVRPEVPYKELRLVSLFLILATLGCFAWVVLQNPGVLMKSASRRDFTPIPEESLDSPAGLSSEDVEEMELTDTLGRPNEESPIFIRRSSPTASSTEGTRHCTTCKILCPPDSSHCDDCGVCIEGLDHHCPWTSKCVGKKNLTAFYLWLVFAIASLVVLFFGCASVIPTDTRRLKDPLKYRLAKQGHSRFRPF